MICKICGRFEQEAASGQLPLDCRLHGEPADVRPRIFLANCRTGPHARLSFRRTGGPDWRAGLRVPTAAAALLRSPYRIGANPAPNAVKIRVVIDFSPRFTSGKSPTAR